MSAPPKTILAVTADEDQAIRNAVRGVDPLTLGPGRLLACAELTAAAFEFLADPAVSGPIYDLPRPLTEASVAAWIADARRQREQGECLLIFTVAPGGTVMGYSKISVWPDRSAAELAGAIKATLQNTGSGGSGAAHTIGWIFDALKVRLICLTAALDNVRSAKLIDRMGFRRMGERESIRPDGTIRRSIYWELTADEWRTLGSAERLG